MPSFGDLAPDFAAATDGGESIRLSDLRGTKVVLYFYPRDGTSGCTTEACSFRDAQPGFAARNAVILGVSPDSVTSHDRFKTKHGLPFRLVSDPDHAIAESYGAWREKSLYGKRYMGVARMTFVIDEAGRIEGAFDKVKVRGHVSEVLDSL